MPNSGKSGTWLGFGRRLGCSSGAGCEEVPAQRIWCRPAVKDGQAGAWRLGLGLTARAPHHQPQRHHHPEDRERLDFRYVEELFVPAIAFE